jgi:hypothetical protein
MRYTSAQATEPSNAAAQTTRTASLPGDEPESNHHHARTLVCRPATAEASRTASRRRAGTGNRACEEARSALRVTDDRDFEERVRRTLTAEELLGHESEVCDVVDDGPSVGNGV